MSSRIQEAPAHPAATELAQTTLAVAIDGEPLPWLAWARWRPWVLGALALAIALAVGLALRELLVKIHYARVLDAVRATPWTDIAWAVAGTAASFLVLSGYDSSGLRYVGAKVDRGTVLLTSFTAYALGNTVGFGVLTGGAVRMRMYTAAGVEPTQVARAIAFNAGAFGLGVTAFGALGLLWGADRVAEVARTPGWVLQGAAAMLLAAVGWLLWLCQHRSEVRIAGRWPLKLPPPQLAWQQLAISGGDLAAAGAALWVLLPEGSVDLPSFVAFYAIALTLSVVSHVPGGLGVFEAVILAACSPQTPAEAVFGALLLYRGIYFLLPLVLAAALLAAYELRSGVAAPVGRAAVHLSPMLLAALTFIAGIWLLFSGVTPSSDQAAQLLAMKVPLPIVEASHFVGSVTGLGLLLVARGLLHRLDIAWWAALALSLLAALLALPKGIALSEAALLSTLALLLVISREQFDRRSSLIAQRLEPEWLLAVAGVVATTIWVLFFAYQDVEYVKQLWWQFEFDAQAPRSLRAITAVALVLGAVSLWHLLRPPTGEPPEPTAADLDRAAAVLHADPHAGAALALMGDKHLLFSDSGRSFIMYGKQKRSWVSLFDPVGDPREFPDLTWRFIELAASHGGRAAFYQVRPQMLPMYLDAGLRAFKLGEHAHVPLGDFSLKGGRRANLRSGVNRAEREGLVFEVLPPERIDDALVAELADVSNAWLRQQNTREKAFSLGAFDAAYLRRLPVAVVRREGKAIAFANLLVTGRGEEASVDLMRHRPDVPNGTMDFLFAKLILHCQAEGMQRFGLGMAPMSGMAEHRLASRWQRFGRLLFDHGERFYSFQGLRSFKEKFDPVWEARYLAAPGGAAPVLALTDVAALIGGGLKGVIAK